MSSQPAEPRYVVVVNHEDQYSIWPEGRELPMGWQATGTAGTKAECLAYIEEVWTDMRPRSLREQMERAGSEPAVAPIPLPEGPTVVERLSQADHPVEVVGLGEDPLAAATGAHRARARHGAISRDPGRHRTGHSLRPAGS